MSGIDRIARAELPEHNFHPVYRADIDGLRALAILAVIAFHAFPKSLRSGYTGVDVFFVISGFLISSIVFKSLVRDDFSFREFYSHRIKRIFPALLVVLASCYAIGWFVLLPGEFMQLGKHLVAGIGFVQNFVLWKEVGYFDSASEFKPLLHLWSLSVEEQFYLFYPLIIWGAWRSGLSILTILVVLGLVSFGMNIEGVRRDATMAFFLPHTRFWELLAGGLIAYIYLFNYQEIRQKLKRFVFHRLVLGNWCSEKDHDGILSNILSSVGFLMIVCSYFVIRKKYLFPGYWALLPVVGACLLILAGPGGFINRRLLANPVMVWIGIISYPLYLWHWPLLSMATILQGELPSLTIRIVAVLLSFVLAWLTYHLIERPIRFGSRKWTKTAGLCVLAIVVAIAGYDAYVRDGLPNRVRDFSGVYGPGREHRYIETAECQKDIGRGYAGICLSEGSPLTKGVAVIGDSHGQVLFSGVDNANNVILGGYAAPALRGVGSKSSLQSNIDPAYNFALQNENIKVVVIVGFWAAYTTGVTLKDPEKTDYGITYKGQRGAAAFASALGDTFAELSRANKKILFVIDVPDIDFNPRANSRACADTRPYILEPKDMSIPCAVAREVADARYANYRKVVFEVAKAYPNVTIFDPAALLCDENYCWAGKDGKMLYVDEHHLSGFGVALLAPELEKVIGKLLEKN